VPDIYRHDAAGHVRVQYIIRGSVVVAASPSMLWRKNDPNLLQVTGHNNESIGRVSLLPELQSLQAPEVLLHGRCRPVASRKHRAKVTGLTSKSCYRPRSYCSDL
jgi:hypothetical protein